MLFDPKVFFAALVSPALFEGAMITIVLSVLVQATAFLTSLPVATGLNSINRGVRWPLKMYVWLFRSAPMILVLLFVWNGLPQVIPSLRADWFSPFLAAYLAMTMVGVAYNAEIMRAALLSVHKGQRETASALGLSRAQVFGLVVMPQALRVALPPLMNEFISLLKSTSLAYTISLRELMTITSLSISASFRFTEWYACAFIYYVVIVSLLTVVQSLIEKRMSVAYGQRLNGWAVRARREAPHAAETAAIS